MPLLDRVFETDCLQLRGNLSTEYSRIARSPKLSAATDAIAPYILLNPVIQTLLVENIPQLIKRHLNMTIARIYN